MINHVELNIKSEVDIYQAYILVMDRSHLTRLADRVYDSLKSKPQLLHTGYSFAATLRNFPFCAAEPVAALEIFSGVFQELPQLLYLY